MLTFFKRLLRGNATINYQQLRDGGAQIVDVRTESEYSQGHIRGAINIPLGKMPQSLFKLRKDKPVITCCASGLRSAQARKVLLGEGFQEVHNGGSWTKLNSKMVLV